jgi:transcriptional regulator with XRE-family HTH domain
MDRKDNHASGVAPMGPEWLRQHEQGDPVMSLRQRVLELRKEHGWSQAELASKIGGDAAQISRYENGRITPSADVIIRLSEVFDVTTDYLVLDDAPKRPQRTPDEAALGDRISAVSELGAEDLALVTSFIDALVTKTRLKVLAGGS